MADRITAGQFHASDGVGDWRVLALGAHACFRTESYAAGVALAGAIGELVQPGHEPDVDIRPRHVAVRLSTSDDDGLCAEDVDAARAISAAAAELGSVADPACVQDVDITVDAAATPAVRPFWAAVLGYDEVGEDDLRDPARSGPSLWFQPVAEPAEGRNRIHLDVVVPHDAAEARIAAAVAAGGRVVYDEHAPAWWTLADPEGNLADIATWQGRDGDG